MTAILTAEKDLTILNKKDKILYAFNFNTIEAEIDEKPERIGSFLYEVY